MTPLRGLAAAQRVVAVTTQQGADAGEAFVLEESTGGARVEKGEVTGVETETRFGIGIRVLKQGRLGFAYAPSAEGAVEAVRLALRASRVSPKLKGFSFPGGPRPIRIAGLDDARVRAMDGPDAIALAGAMIDAVADVDARLQVTEAGVGYGTTSVALANSEGAAVTHRDTSLGLSCFVVQRDVGVSTGFEGRESTRLDVDPEAVGRAAAELCLKARRPKKLAKGGVIPIVVRPEPFGDLVGTLTLPNLYGKAAHRDESFYSGKVGRTVANAGISLVDDPTRPRGLGSAPFDDEGVASRAFAPVRRGRLVGFFFDAATGAEFGESTTGSAQRSHGFDGRSYKGPPSAGARNVHIEGPSRSTEKLISGIDDGLFLHDLLGVHTANVVSGDFSVTSTVLFRIRKGAIEGPVAPLSVAGNFHATLRKGFVLGDDFKPLSGEGALRVPSARIDDFTVTP